MTVEVTSLISSSRSGTGYSGQRNSGTDRESKDGRKGWRGCEIERHLHIRVEPVRLYRRDRKQKLEQKGYL